MEQSTVSPDTATRKAFDAAVPPAGSLPAEPPRSTATRRIGAAVGSLGERLRSPSVTGRVGAADAVGRGLQRAGGYFDTHDLADIRTDLERFIVRRPIASVLLALGAGYLAGRAVWR